jgi:ABC-2 type transport system permease protein
LRPEVLRSSLRARRRGYIGWIIGIAALTAFTFAFYPSMRDNAEIAQVIEDLPESLRSFVGEKDVASPEGYLESQLFLYVVPVLLFVYAIGQAADTIAGAEKRKTLDLLLANPVSRTRVLLEKFGAICVGLLGLGLVLTVMVLGGAPAVDMDIPVEGLIAVVVGCVLLALTIGALALAIGAGTGKKGLAVAIASAVALAAYLIHSLAPQVDALETVQKVSPWYYYIGGDPLVNGIQWLDLAVLAAISGALVALAGYLFNRRDMRCLKLDMHA